MTTTRLQLREERHPHEHRRHRSHRTPRPPRHRAACWRRSRPTRSPPSSATPTRPPTSPPAACSSRSPTTTAPRPSSGAFAAGDKVLLISGSEVGQRVPQHTGRHRRRQGGRRRAARVHQRPGRPAAASARRRPQGHRGGDPRVRPALRPAAQRLVQRELHREPGPRLEHGAVVGAAGEGRVASAARADYAAAAAAVLTGEGHENKAYELSGDTAWSFAEYAAEVAQQSGKEIAYRAVSAEKSGES